MIIVHSLCREDGSLLWISASTKGVQSPRFRGSSAKVKLTRWLAEKVSDGRLDMITFGRRLARMAEEACRGLGVALYVSTDDGSVTIAREPA